MKYNIVLGAAAAAALLLAAPAQAQTTATATWDLNVRSGPGPEYPVIDVIAEGGQADLLGCLEGSRWCQVHYNGIEGWAYSKYLVTAHPTREVVVLERPRYSRERVVVREDDRGRDLGVAAGVTGGAVAGTILGGPIGGAVGGIAGATFGTAVAPPPTMRTYVLEHEVEPVYLEREVTIGTGLPHTVRTYDIPGYDYDYVYVNERPVIVEPTERRIVYVVR